MASDSVIRAAWIAAGGAVVAAVIGLADIDKDKGDGPATPTESAAPTSGPQPVATADISGAPSVAHGDSLELSVTATNLGGRSLWIVSTPEAGGGYYLVGNSPTTDVDGTASYISPVVGDASDIGHDYRFKAYVADASCAKFLSAVPFDEERQSHYTAVIDESCGLPVDTHALTVE